MRLTDARPGDHLALRSMPADAGAGQYAGRIAVTADGGARLEVPLTHDVSRVARRVGALDGWGDSRLGEGLRVAAAELNGDRFDALAHRRMVVVTDGEFTADATGMAYECAGGTLRDLARLGGRGPHSPLGLQRTADRAGLYFTSVTGTSANWITLYAVEPRKRFIETHAIYAKNIDI